MTSFNDVIYTPINETITACRVQWLMRKYLRIGIYLKTLSKVIALNVLRKDARFVVLYFHEVNKTVYGGVGVIFSSFIYLFLSALFIFCYRLIMKREKKSRKYRTFGTTYASIFLRGK